MYLVPNMVVPKMFCILELFKYTRTECPVTYLKTYFNKIMKAVHDDKLLIHFFQDSLSGAILNWYMRLQNTNIHNYKDLIDDFIK